MSQAAITWHDLESTKGEQTGWYARRVRHEVSDEFVGPFECRHCGFETTARVRAIGRRAWLPTGPREAGGARIRGEGAAEIAGVVASRTLMFVRCPRCGKRDPSATTYRVQVVLGALLAGVAAGVLAFLGMVKSFRSINELALGTAMAAGLGVAAGVWWTYRRAWVRVDERVVLAEPDPPGS